MPRVFPPEPRVSDKDRPCCPRCGGSVYKQPRRTYYTGRPDEIPRYVCKVGRKERTCGVYWRQGGSGDLYFSPTQVSHDGLLAFTESPLDRAYHATISDLHHALVAVVRPKGATGFPEDELLYACPARPDYRFQGVLQDWTPEFKKFLCQHQDRIVGIPQDVLDGLPYRREWVTEQGVSGKP